MAIADFSGYWTGKLEGTNQGGFALEITQSENRVAGVAKISEPALGQYEYLVQGEAGDTLSVRLTPGRQSSSSFILGNVTVVASIDAQGSLVGRWSSDIGTEGTLHGTRFDNKLLVQALPKTNSVFLVHGHDEGAKHGVARFLEKLGVKPVILQEQLNQGMTIIEKFEQFAARAGFAIVLMTPDDYGYPVGKEEDKKSRPRQNVILELGYFTAKLGREKTMVLVKGDVELPSDVFGLVYEPIDKGEGWKMRVARELKAAGFEIDLNNTIGDKAS